MMTPVPALVVTLAFLCQGWGKHFLLDTKDSNLTDLQYNEDYLSTCRSGCTQNYHCPRQCPYCRRGDEEYRRLKVTDWEGKKRKKRAVNGLKVEKRCYATKQQRRATTKKSGGSCFGPTNTVETKEGMKTLCELRIGDLIRTSSGVQKLLTVWCFCALPGMAWTLTGGILGQQDGHDNQQQLLDHEHHDQGVLQVTEEQQWQLKALHSNTGKPSCWCLGLR